MKLGKSLRHGDLSCWFNVDPLLPALGSGRLLALRVRGEVGPDPAPLAPLGYGKAVQDRALWMLPPAEAPHFPPVLYPPAPGQLPGAPGLGEEWEGYVLICCERRVLGRLWFGFWCGLLWGFFVCFVVFFSFGFLFCFGVVF